MTLDELKTLRADGKFHHATYRNLGTIWEGLYIYQKKDSGWRGFEIAGVFGKNDPNLPAAEDLLRGTGISVGAYGQG